MSVWSVCQVADRTHLLSGRISFGGGIMSIYQTPQFVPRFAFPSHLQSPVASTEQPSWLEIVAKVLLVAGTGYLVYKALEAPKVRRYCSGCGRGGHNARNCPYTGERRAFSTDVVKTGWCECCGYWFAKTHLHHWRGRADDSRSMEMCPECHVQCGHDGHTRNFAIKPRYCRVA